MKIQIDVYPGEIFVADGKTFESREGLRDYCEARVNSENGQPQVVRIIMYSRGEMPFKQFRKIADWKHNVLDSMLH